MSQMNDSINDKLNSIATHINDIAERNIIGEIDDAARAFELHDALQELPTPSAPAHLHRRAA